MQLFDTKNYLQNNKKMGTLHSTLNNVICVTIKIEKSLHTRENLTEQRSELIKKCRHQNKFSRLRQDSKK